MNYVYAIVNEEIESPQGIYPMIAVFKSEQAAVKYLDRIDEFFDRFDTFEESPNCLTEKEKHDVYVNIEIQSYNLLGDVHAYITAEPRDYYFKKVMVNE